MLPLSHSLSTASRREEEFRKYLFFSNNLATWSKSCETCHLTNALHVSALSLPLQAHQSLSALFHTRIRVCKDFLPLWIMSLLAHPSGSIDLGLSTVECRQRRSPLLCPLDLFPESLAKGGDLAIPEHAPIPDRTFCTLLLPETLVCPGHWPTFGKT